MLRNSARAYRVSVSVALLAAASVSCSGTQTDDPLASSPSPSSSATTQLPSETPAPTGAPSATGQTTPRDSPDVRPVTLAFAGDVHFMEELAPLLDDPTTALDPITAELSAADITMVNLETAITERGQPEPKKYTFRAPGEAFDALAAAGVDVVTMANNHAVDYGATGLADTLALARRAPLQVVGVGVDASQAYAPAYIDVRGTTVAFLGATQIPDRTLAVWSASTDSPGVASSTDRKRLTAAVRAAGKNSDVVVVYLHYGVERVDCPVSDQRSVVEDLIESGADVVIGSHAHVLLGAGWSGDTYVAYGLGNYIWYSPNSEREATTGVLTLTLSEGNAVRKARFSPAFIGQDGMPLPHRGADAAAARKQWLDLRECTGLSSKPRQ